MPAGGFDPSDTAGLGSDCHPPQQLYDVQQNRVEQAYDPADLDADHTWVTVERREPVISSDLGCAGLFCDLPTSGTVMPRS